MYITAVQIDVSNLTVTCPACVTKSNAGSDNTVSSVSHFRVVFDQLRNDSMIKGVFKLVTGWRQARLEVK